MRESSNNFKHFTNFFMIFLLFRLRWRRKWFSRLKICLARLGGHSLDGQVNDNCVSVFIPIDSYSLQLGIGCFQLDDKYHLSSTLVLSSHFLPYSKRPFIMIWLRWPFFYTITMPIWIAIISQSLSCLDWPSFTKGRPFFYIALYSILENNYSGDNIWW